MKEILKDIANYHKAIDFHETIAAIQERFEDVLFTHFPVIEYDSYIGCMIIDDLNVFDVNKRAVDYRFTLEPFFATTTMNWFEVLTIFARNDTNLIPVLDQGNKYVGYYEIESIMKFFQQTTFLKEQGEEIIIQKEILSYSMSQVAQIIESNHGKLLGLFISEANEEMAQITIKISSGSINDIIQTFRRYDYEIISEHKQDNYINNLKEHSDYLDKYLNI